MKTVMLKVVKTVRFRGCYHLLTYGSNRQKSKMLLFVVNNFYSNLLFWYV